MCHEACSEKASLRRMTTKISVSEKIRKITTVKHSQISNVSDNKVVRGIVCVDKIEHL